MNRQTYLAKNDEVARNWWVIDATDLVMGRLCTKLATVLMGKHKPEYTPHHDVGDFIVVLNADKLKTTGKKEEYKLYRTFSGHPSGQKTRTYSWMLEHKPEELLTTAVKRMMPGNKLASHQINKLKVYRGTDHPHTAQQPQTLTL